LPDGQAAKLLYDFVVHSLMDGLSVEQKHGLDVPFTGHWWVEFYAYDILLVNQGDIVRPWMTAAPVVNA